MNVKKFISSAHLASTVWFILCTGYVFTLAMRQAGFNWLIIFSLSGYWALSVTLFVNFYLFTIYRGTAPGPDIQTEHPLTSTAYYNAFYLSAPFLGAIGGIFGTLGDTGIDEIVVGMAMGTIAVTFLTWIVLDPVVGSLEILMPQPRAYRNQRLIRIKLQKEQDIIDREKLLENILKLENEKKLLWQKTLAPDAIRLAGLLANESLDFAKAEQEAIKIGVQAWRMGGVSCMKQLHNMAIIIFRERYNQSEFFDYLCLWWDGIGNWRNKSLVSV